MGFLGGLLLAVVNFLTMSHVAVVVPLIPSASLADIIMPMTLLGFRLQTCLRSSMHQRLSGQTLLACSSRRLSFGPYACPRAQASIDVATP